MFILTISVKMSSYCIADRSNRSFILATHSLNSEEDDIAEYESLYANISGENEVFTNERTPLLARRSQSRLKILTPLFISVMLLILVPGMIISIYLLIEDGREWPVNTVFELISRSEWGAKPPTRSGNLNTKPASNVILTKSATPPCESRASCQRILIDLQVTYQSLPHNLSDIPFNFLIGGDGETYEGRGWDIQGDVSKDFDSKSISVAIIGNITSPSPSSIQMKEFNALLNESVRRKKLQRSYKVIKKYFN